MVDIRDKVAVITGAGRGIGRAIAIDLGRAGARVARGNMSGGFKLPKRRFG